jgi:serine/threonine protein kinase
MVVQAGATFQTEQGNRKCILGPLAPGGQGDTYWATDVQSHQREVIKLFRHIDRDTLTRLRYLQSLELQKASAVLWAPTEIISQNGLGHSTPAAPGVSLEKYLERPNSTFLENVQLATAVVAPARLLESRGIAYGDYHADNCLVIKQADVVRVALIDLDNFAAPGVPPPPCAGQLMYMAPEIRKAFLAGQFFVPNLRSDRFALAVLLHEILLLRHPTAGVQGVDTDEAAFHKAMCSGRWLHDPLSPDRPKGNVGGVPPEALNGEICRLFRRAFSLRPEDRPTCDEWLRALARASGEVFLCPHCGHADLIDASKQRCTWCSHAYPVLKLRLAGGEIALAQPAVKVGRDQLGGSPVVSSEHASFFRLGPETWCKPLGRNGTYRWARGRWQPLELGKAVLVEKSDRLRFADVEGQLVEA